MSCGAPLPENIRAVLPALKQEPGRLAELRRREVNAAREAREVAAVETTVARKLDDTGVPRGPSAVSTALRTRYVDAYRVARVINEVGTTIKIIGFILAGFVAMGSVTSLTTRNPFTGGTSLGVGVVGFVIAAFVALVGFVLGTLVSAQGQILMATLDTSVNSSPFLRDDDRAWVLGVPVPGAQIVQ